MRNPHVVEEAQRRDEKEATTEEQNDRQDPETQGEPLALKIAEEEAIDEGKI